VRLEHLLSGEVFQEQLDRSVSEGQGLLRTPPFWRLGTNT